MKKRLIQFILFSALATLPIWNAAAINYGTGTYGSCQYNSCSISLTSNGTVTLNVTPVSGGSCTIQSDTASVATDNSSGFSLTLADLTTNTALVNGAATIPATAGTFASPIALVANKWGYRVDGAGGFGAGPTSSQSNISPPGTTFAGIKPSDQTADTIVSTSAPANPAVDTSVWYGVCAATDVIPGSYTTVVTYTAVTN